MLGLSRLVFGEGIIDCVELSPMHSGTDPPTGLGSRLSGLLCGAVDLCSLIYKSSGCVHIPRGPSTPGPPQVGPGGIQTQYGAHPAPSEHGGPRDAVASGRRPHPAVAANRVPVRVQVRPAARAALLRHLHPRLWTDRGAVCERDHVQHAQVL